MRDRITEVREDRPLLVRPAEVARLLGISRSKCYALLATGELPGAVRVGQSIRISRVVLERWIEDQSEGDTAA